MKDFWNVILHTVADDKVKAPKNNPKKSGNYLCTCIQYWNGEEVNRYLQVMAYNAEKGFWHDCNHPHGISHVILAWTNKVKPCKFQSFDYLAGGILVEKGQGR